MILIPRALPWAEGSQAFSLKTEPIMLFSPEQYFSFRVFLEESGVVVVDLECATITKFRGQDGGKLSAKSFESRRGGPAFPGALLDRIFQEDPQLSEQQREPDEEQSPAAVAAGSACLGLVE